MSKIGPAIFRLAGGRNVLYVDTLSIRGVDLSGATLKMQVRLYPDAPSTPLIDLAMAASNAQGLSVTVTTDDDAIPTSVIQIRINKTTMQGMPATNPLGEDAELAYDLTVSGGGFDEGIWFKGPFVVEGSVTR